MTDAAHEQTAQTSGANPITEQFAALRARSRVVDLSPVLQSDMPGWSTNSCMSLIDARSHARHGYYSQTLMMSEHTGAHVDAAHHIHADLPDRTVDAFAPDQLIGTFKKLDLGGLDLKPGDLVDVDQVKQAAATAGVSIERDDVVLVDFGWSRFFRPDDPDWAVRRWWADNAPGLADSACAYLAERGIRAIGSDTAACDAAVVEGEVVADHGHRTYFLPSGIPIIEGLVELAQLPPSGIFLAMPLRVHRGSGAPLRPIALCEEVRIGPPSS